MTSTLTIDDLQFEVRRSARRKTLQLTVDRGGELLLYAPAGTPSETLERFVREKQFWVYTKLAEKKSAQGHDARREFVSGESFPYLGRTYRLLLVEGKGTPLKLHQGRFELLRSEAARGREHFVRWYSTHARPWLARRVPPLARRVGNRPTGLEVRELGYRWASCSEGGRLNFHWATILLPPRIIDYVIAHELVHLIEKNHTPEFWRRVERVLPDFERRRAWLADRGSELVNLRELDSWRSQT